MLKEIQTRNRIPFREVVEKLKTKVFSVSYRKYDLTRYVYLLASRGQFAPVVR